MVDRNGRNRLNVDGIAVDGPAASGKTVVGRRLASMLGYRFVDTGAMYRAVTVLALEQGVSPYDARGLTSIAGRFMFEAVEPHMPSMPQRIMVNGRDLTVEVRAQEVDQAVSEVSQVPGVREVLVGLQREVARNGSIVMAGRDIGTVVLPDAPTKVFLDASVEARAGRRHREMGQWDPAVRYEHILEDLRRRDTADSERRLSPLKPAADAYRVDTEGCTIEEVVEKLWQFTVG